MQQTGRARPGETREQGRRVMLAEMQRQVYDDGSYVQHSVNYHRVMLDDCLWAMRIGQLHDEPLEQIAEQYGDARRSPIVQRDEAKAFSEDELVTVVRKEDLEWLREALRDLKKDNEN